MREASSEIARKDLVVLGHWMVDDVVSLPADVSLAERLPSRHVHAAIVRRLGGSGYHFSLAARRAGFTRVIAPASIGRDPAGRELREAARDAGVDLRPSWSAKPTARAFLLYDSAGRRASFGTRDANLDLPRALESKLRTLRHANVFVSGHLLEDQDNRVMMLKLVQQLRANECFVVLDVVPHHLQEIIAVNERNAISEAIHGVIGTRSALRAFTTHNADVCSDEALVSDLSAMFEWVCMHPTNAQLIVGYRRANHYRLHRMETSYGSFQVKAGALDYAVARALYEFLAPS